MKISKILLSTAVLASLSIIAFADDVNAANVKSNQIYVGAEAGAGDMGFDLNKYKSYALANNGSYDIKQNNFYGAIHAGMLFPVTDALSLGGQVGYQMFGDHSAEASETIGNTTNSSKESEKISDFNAVAVIQGTYDNFFANVNGGLGYFMVRNSGSITNYNTGAVSVAPKSKNSVEPIAGLEAGYNFTDHFNTYLAYNHVFGSNTNNDFSNKVPTMNTFGLGVNYVF